MHRGETVRAATAAQGRDRGQVTAMVVIMVAALILLAGLVFDGGQVQAARGRALTLAQEAARAGAEGINLGAYRQDGTLELLPEQAEADARAYLAAAGVQGTVEVAGDTVTVTVTITVAMEILSAAGLGAATVHATASAIPEEGQAAS